MFLQYNGVGEGGALVAKAPLPRNFVMVIVFYAHTLTHFIIPKSFTSKVVSTPLQYLCICIVALSALDYAYYFGVHITLYMYN